MADANTTPKKRPHSYWTNERIAAEAKKYSSRGEFRSKSSSAYQRALRRRIDNEVCSHMKGGGRRLQQGLFTTRESVLTEALKYGCRASFCKGSRTAYYKALKEGWLDRACNHMQPKGDYENRFIYILKDSCRVYAGLTYDPSTRLNKYRHTALNEMDDAIHVYISPFPMPIKIAKKVESKLIQLYRSKSYPLKCINRSGGGEIGSACSWKWTDERIADEAKKYTSRRKFSDGCSSAYKAAGRRGIRDKVCSHMTPSRKPQGYWQNKSNIISFAKSCSSRGEFSGNVPAMKGAAELGIRAEVDLILPKPKNKNWTKAKVLRMAKQYPTKNSMLKKNDNLSQAASRLGIYEEATAHMISEREYKKINMGNKSQGTYIIPV